MAGGRPGETRTPRDELAEGTPHGDVYLRRLVREQLSLSLLALGAFGTLVGVLPAALFLLPGLARFTLLGVPVPIVLMAVPLFPLFVVIAWAYGRRADALDVEFRELVRDE
jgi:hypothetical protein